jgi:hypothetical protein
MFTHLLEQVGVGSIAGEMIAVALKSNACSMQGDSHIVVVDVLAKIKRETFKRPFLFLPLLQA